MTTLYDIVDADLYADMLQQKYIKEKTHPKFPQLTIVNYTDSCMWDQVWNDVTMTCRGLIFNNETKEIIARPFRKFFNTDQQQAPSWGLTELVQVTDKLDGSLGILYQQPDGRYAIATRGSFASDQAEWGTEVFQGMYEEEWTPNPELTYLFELIYPENRIVVDYEGVQSLVLIGAVEISTGKSVSVDDLISDWIGISVPVFEESMTYEEALSLPERDNAEGYVFWNMSSDERMKIKYERYKELHRYLTNTSARHVWEVLSEGKNPNEIFAAAPDEFHDWVKEVISELETQNLEIKTKAWIQFMSIRNSLPEGAERKDFALAVQDAEYRSLMFMWYDGKSVDDVVWKMIKPSGNRTFKTVSSDAD